jgi:hypothetical protein
MKRLLLILILTLNFQILAKADDVHDFEIYGLSVGDSLLKFKSKSIIKKQEKSFMPSLNGEKFYRIAFKIEDDNYDFVAFYLKKNDAQYKIYGLEGLKYSNYSKCKKKMNKIHKDMKKSFSENYKLYKTEDFHSYDKSNKSKVKIFDFTRSDNYTISRIVCTDWGKKLEAKGFGDNLAIYLQSEEFSKFLLNEAYK